MTDHGSLVVGYDGSAPSRAAIDHALAVARGRRIVIVHAYEAAPEHLAARWRELLDREHRQAAQSVLDAVLLEGHDTLADAEWEARLAEGRPADALVRVADDLGADAIVVGSHGYGAVGALLGSVSHELLRESTRPVTVIPPRCAESMAAMPSLSARCTGR